MQEIKNQIVLYHQSGSKWLNQQNIWFKGYQLSGNRLRSTSEIFSELIKIDSEECFRKWLMVSNGCFSVILNNNNKLFAAVDNIRSLPLFYTIENHQIIITDNPVYCFETNYNLNLKACIELESAAYVCGNKTLFENVYQLQAGEYLIFENGKLFKDFYTDYQDIKIDHSPFQSLQNKLKEVLENIFDRLVKSLEGRQAVIPLSGGYDSRFIALMLKKAGYQQIKTFTYGRFGNFELENSKKTAERLNIPWIFIEYDKKLINNYLNDETFNNYIHFAGKASSMFYMQDYFGVKYLHDNHLIEKDAVFIPGHTGDFIAGSHLRPYMEKWDNKNQILKEIYKLSFIQNNHKKYKKYLNKEIQDFTENQLHKIKNYQIFEQWDTMERQAKFVVNSSSVFNYFGYEFRLPYWDKELVDFFNSVPFEFKLYKKLYNSTLEELFFKLFNLNFTKELQANAFIVKKQQIKNFIKPFLPVRFKLKYLEKNDWMAYSLITEKMLEELKNKGISYKFKADSYNSIISFWYLCCFRGI